jgi:hypothetical protein
MAGSPVRQIVASWRGFRPRRRWPGVNRAVVITAGEPGRQVPAPHGIRCLVTERADREGWYLAAEHMIPARPGQSGHLRAVLGDCEYDVALNASVLVAPLPAAAHPAVEAECILAGHPGARVAAVIGEDDCCWLVITAAGKPLEHWRLRGAQAGDPAVYASIALGFAVLRGSIADLDLLRPWVRIAVDGEPLRHLLADPG